MQKITPMMWFDSQAEEAANHYVRIFKDGKINHVARYTEAGPGTPGSVMVVDFELHGQRFTALNGGPIFKFSEAVSYVIHCKDQAEVDYYWAALLEGGGKESQCGWLKDKFGFSWQVVPERALELLTNPDPAVRKRVSEAVYKMIKLDLAAIERAAKGAEPMPAKDADAYLAKLSADKRATLEKVRKAIRAAAPDAEEGMSYGMPAFIQGKPIAGYNASANHCSYFPMSGAITAKLVGDLKNYEVSKGGFRFPIGKPPPATLIRKLVKARLAEIEAPRPAKKAAKKVAESDAAVAAYLESLKHPLKKEIEAVRLIILGVSPAINEGIKWNVPSFRIAKEWFSTFNVRSRDNVQLIFHLGAKTRPDLKAFKLADPNGLVKWLGSDRAMVTLGAGRDIAANRKALEAIVRAWIKHV